MRFGHLERSMSNTWNEDGRDDFVPPEADSREQDADSQQPPWHPGRSGELSTSPLLSHQSRNRGYDSPRMPDMAIYDQPLESLISNREGGADDTAAGLGHPGRPHNQDSSMEFDSALQFYGANVDGVTSFSEHPSYDDTGVYSHDDLTAIRGPHSGVSQPIIPHFYDPRFDHRYLHSNKYPMYWYQDHEPAEDRKPAPVDRPFRETHNPEESNEEDVSNLKSPPVASLPAATSRRASAPRERPPTRECTRLKRKPNATAGRAFRTVTGERTSECRLRPSKEELDDAPNSRTKKALKTWYERLGELDHFRREHGHSK